VRQRRGSALDCRVDASILTGKNLVTKTDKQCQIGE